MLAIPPKRKPFQECEVDVGERFSSSRLYIYRGNKAMPSIVGVARHTGRTTSLGQSVAVVNGNDATSNAVGSLSSFSPRFLSPSTSPFLLHLSLFSSSLTFMLVSSTPLNCGSCRSTTGRDLEKI